MKKAIMLINDTTYAYNLRGAIIKKLISEDFEVIVVGQLLKHQDKLVALGARLIGVETGRHGTNPFADLSLLKIYYDILKKERPTIVLTYNIKPNVYGGIACQLLKIPYLTNVTGLGTPLETPNKLQFITITLYKIGIAGSSCVFFQNYDNQVFFENHHMLKNNTRTHLLPGSGVDLDEHPILPWPNDDEIHFLYAARVMKEKGIDLFLAAANKFASDSIIFDVCGLCDDPEYLSILSENNSIVYHGEQSDMTPFYQRCSCFLFPSYYPEGMSNVLLEAAASGRPVIAADRPGCRETVDDGITGFIIPINDELAVINAVKKILEMSNQNLKVMGQKGRERMNNIFDRSLVVDAYFDEIKFINVC